MAFWNELALEPKRKFRWFLYFAGLPQFIVKQVKKPSFKIGSKAHDFLNYQFHYPGKVTWDDINFTIIDPIQPDSVHSFMKILKAAGYDMPNKFVENASASSAKIRSVTKKSLADSFGGQMQLVQLGTSEKQDEAGGPGLLIPVEKWLIHNPMITSVDFGDLDYSGDDILDIKVGIKYDFAELAEGVGGQSTFSTDFSEDLDFGATE